MSQNIKSNNQDNNINPTPLKSDWLGATEEEFKLLIKITPSPGASTRRILYLIGILLTPITLAGVLIGYVIGYTRVMYPQKRDPDLYNIPSVVKWAMVIGGMLAWLILFLIITIGVAILGFFSSQGVTPLIALTICLVEAIICFIMMAQFRGWQVGYFNLRIEQQRFGTAEYAEAKDLAKYKHDNGGFYIGNAMGYSDRGHLITVAGTRGGKGTNIIIPNLLGHGSSPDNGFNGSWIIIDPKGENAAITARYQREQGKNVIILNPWNLLKDQLGKTAHYNPLDLLIGADPMNLIDDVAILVEMIVPFSQNGKDDFFDDRARSLISGLLLYLVLQKEEDKTLATLWSWLRLPKSEFDALLRNMITFDDDINGEIVKNTALEMASVVGSERTYTSIIATAQKYTDFLKSPALQQSIFKSDIDINKLADGNTVMYIIIPADKLKSQFKWLRLIITTTMRAVVRNPNKRVAFLLDEFAALGYMSEIETALSTYAGYGVTVWAIIQSLIQLKNEYGDNWETFLGNTNVQHFFSVGDNFTADYVSKIYGISSFVTYKPQGLFGITQPTATKRELVTPDEIRRESLESIFAVIDKAHRTYFKKKPYYEMPALHGRHDPNPYIIDDSQSGGSSPSGSGNGGTPPPKPPIPPRPTGGGQEPNKPRNDDGEDYPAATKGFTGLKQLYLDRLKENENNPDKPS